ncbi:MAG: hypothetical protein ABSF12_15960 [Bryobacteraceae bacterium]|jgi:hypothetical protein
MTESKLPKGWTETKIKRVVAHYEKQTERDAVAEDEAGVTASETVMSIPRDLVPAVRELIAKRRR